MVATGNLKDILAVVKKYGIGTCFNTLSATAWFLLPFALWFQIYVYFGFENFSLSWVAIIGLCVVAILLVVVIVNAIQVIRLDDKLFKHVQSAKQLFSNPLDKNADEKFRIECHAFIIPYLYHSHLLPFGSGGLGFYKSRFSKVISRVIQVFIALYLSYSIFVLSVISWAHISPYLNYVLPFLPYSDTLATIFTFAIQNLAFTLVIVFSLSIFFMYKSLHFTYHTFLSASHELFVDPLSLYKRVMLLMTLIVASPWAVLEKRRSAKIAPYTLSTDNLVEVITKTVQNIERKTCNVSKFTYRVNDEKDIDALKAIIKAQPGIPPLIKASCLSADDKKALEEICSAQPELFLGLIGNRCAIACSIRYDDKKKIYSAKLSFDSIYLKNEFQLIADKLIDKQKDLKGDMPKDIQGLWAKYLEDKQ